MRYCLLITWAHIRHAASRAVLWGEGCPWGTAAFFTLRQGFWLSCKSMSSLSTCYRTLQLALQNQKKQQQPLSGLWSLAKMGLKTFMLHMKDKRIPTCHIWRQSGSRSDNYDPRRQMCVNDFCVFVFQFVITFCWIWSRLKNVGTQSVKHLLDEIQNHHVELNLVLKWNSKISLNSQTHWLNPDLSLSHFSQMSAQNLMEIILDCCPGVFTVLGRPDLRTLLGCCWLQSGHTGSTEVSIKS